ncbi:hypothetical protein YPPY90_2831, partial [Yersinia pestis PY-90]|jgi:hypothetical protein
MAIT